jgi:hypothetical protein
MFTKLCVNAMVIVVGSSDITVTKGDKYRTNSDKLTAGKMDAFFKSSLCIERSSVFFGVWKNDNVSNEANHFASKAITLMIVV